MSGPSAPSIPERFNAAEYFVDRHLSEGRGNKIAVLYREARLTYADLQALVNRAASAFAHAGIARQDRILLVLPDSPAFVAAFWGAIKLGSIPVPVSTALPSADYQFMLSDTSARGVVLHESVVERVAPSLSSPVVSSGLKRAWVAEGRPPAGWASLEEELEHYEARCVAADTHRDDPAFWLYTSGSTGRPKAAVHLHHDMVCCLESYAKQVLGITAQDITFSTSKLFFAYGLGNALYFPAGVGASSVLVAERPATERIFETVRRYRPTIFFAVPAIYAAMLQAAQTEASCDLASVRCAVSAGEALPMPLWERFRERFGISILDGIGSTEMLHMFISNRPDDVAPGSSGRLVPGYAARLVDEQEKDIPAGQIGNLWISGESSAAGYWNRPDLTARTFRGEWTMTGDKYTRDERGYFWYCGRSDDMMKVSGQWVSPLEVETALLAHPAILECAVVGLADSEGLTRLKAFLVLKDPQLDSRQLETDLRPFLHCRLPRYKVPHWFVVTDALPRTATGKIQRFKLRQ